MLKKKTTEFVGKFDYVFKVMSVIMRNTAKTFD